MHVMYMQVLFMQVQVHHMYVHVPHMHVSMHWHMPMLQAHKWADTDADADVEEGAHASP